MLELAQLNGCDHIRDTKDGVWVRVTQANLRKALLNIEGVTARDIEGKTKEQLLRFWHTLLEG